MRLLASAITMALLAACTQATNPVRALDDSADVRAATIAWGDAYNSRDPARITAMYAPDAVFWGTTSKTIRRTPAEIAEYFKDAGKRPEARVRIGPQNPRAWGEVAVNSGSYTFSDLRDGQRTESEARFTMVFHRREGRWTLVDHHSSRVPQ